MTTNSQLIIKTPLQRAVAKYEERNGCPFVPTRKMFYDRVGINQKRFGMLLRGELPLYDFEVVKLARFFGVEVTELLNEEVTEKNEKSPTTAPTV